MWFRITQCNMCRSRRIGDWFHLFRANLYIPSLAVGQGRFNKPLVFPSTSSSPGMFSPHQWGLFTSRLRCTSRCAAPRTTNKSLVGDGWRREAGNFTCVLLASSPCGWRKEKERERCIESSCLVAIRMRKLLQGKKGKERERKKSSSGSRNSSSPTQVRFKMCLSVSSIVHELKTCSCEL